MSYVFLEISTLCLKYCLAKSFYGQNILQFLMLVSNMLLHRFCVCEYVDVEFLFLFGETSAIIYKPLNVFPIYKCKMVWCFTNGDNNFFIEVLPGDS